MSSPLNTIAHLKRSSFRSNKLHIDICCQAETVNTSQEQAMIFVIWFKYPYQHLNANYISKLCSNEPTPLANIFFPFSVLFLCYFGIFSYRWPR